MVITLILYYDVSDDRAGIMDRQGALFFMVINTAFTSINNVVLVFPAERENFIREVNNGMYSVSSYFWAKLFTEIPIVVA